nr:MAG TPA: hypothetical protein [Bacteriophage sp.]
MHPQKPLNGQILLHPIPYPATIAAPIFPGIPYPATLSHKKEDAHAGRPSLTLDYLALYPCPVPNHARKRRNANSVRIIPCPH